MISFSGNSARRTFLFSLITLLVAFFHSAANAETYEVEKKGGILFAEPEGGVYKLLGGPVKENLEAARRASPATYISKGDPALLILHGDKDKTVFLDQSQHLEKLYKAAGLDAHLHIVEGARHGWKGASDGEEKLVLDFLQRILRDERASK